MTGCCARSCLTSAPSPRRSIHPSASRTWPRTDALRRRYRSARFEIAEAAAGASYAEFADRRLDGLDAAHAAADCLGRAITRLPCQQREAVELLRLRELSLAEAAQATGRSVAALKVNVHRALRALQLQLHAD